MVDDIRFEAAFLRAVLLVGLVNEQEVPSWAEALLPASGSCRPQLSDLLAAPVELSRVREALAPIAAAVDESRVTDALIAAVAADQWIVPRTVEDRVRILGLIRREFALAESVAAAIKTFEDRAMLAAAGVPGETPPGEHEIARWLDAARRPAYFLFSFSDADHAAAFAAALSRTIVRDRTCSAADRPPRAWVVRETSTHGCVLVVNEPAWLTAVREFSPVPLGSRIPYAALPEEAVVMLEEMTAVPLGAEDAHARLFGSAATRLG